jgi:hypothetical protein
MYKKAIKEEFENEENNFCYPARFMGFRADLHRHSQ